jgi:hypothetical protein
MLEKSISVRQVINGGEYKNGERLTVKGQRMWAAERQNGGTAERKKKG